MDKHPKISVIVPIYKVEDYLNRCIESIVNQTYINLEIILVDDGSPDNCPKMCDDWAKKDSRIKVIHKENGGLSDARNAGMKIATGEYIAFVDSDDYVSQDFIRKLYYVLQIENSDIVECNVVKVYEDGRVDDFAEDLLIKSFATEEALEGLIGEKPFHQHVWNKLYKAELINNIFFEVSKLNEDEFWTYQVFGRAKRVSKINETMYYYLQRSSSIMGANYSIRRLDALEAKAIRQKYLEKKYPSLGQVAKTDFYGSCIFAYQCVLKYMSGSDKKKAAGIIKEYKKLCEPSYNEIKTVDGGSRKYFYLSKANFYVCAKMRAILGIGF